MTPDTGSLFLLFREILTGSPGISQISQAVRLGKPFSFDG